MLICEFLSSFKTRMQPPSCQESRGAAWSNGFSFGEGRVGLLTYNIITMGSMKRRGKKMADNLLTNMLQSYHLPPCGWTLCVLILST